MGDPIILSEDNSLLGESAAAVRKAVDAGVLYHCPHDADAPPTLRPQHWPCGFSHAGGSFYHYQPGKGFGDYVEAT